MSNIKFDNTKKTLQLAKELALKGIVPECQKVAQNFFTCIEENLKPYDKNGNPLTYQQLELELNKNVIPMCMKKYDLESCLKQYDSNFQNNNKSNSQVDQKL